MRCVEARRRIEAYADDELGLETTLEIEAHLERCTSCREIVREARGFRRAVAELYPRESLPPTLEASVTRALEGPTRRDRLPALAGLAVAAVALLALLGSLRGGLAEARPIAVDSAVALHEAAVRGDLRVALDSPSLPAVSRWLARELPFLTPIGEGAPEFRLAGASAVDLGGERAALVAYRREGEPVSLFVLPLRAWGEFGRTVRFRGIEFRESAVGAHRVIAWSHAPVSYLLVSTLERRAGEACAVCHLGADARAFADYPHLPAARASEAFQAPRPTEGSS